MWETCCLLVAWHSLKEWENWYWCNTHTSDGKKCWLLRRILSLWCVDYITNQGAVGIVQKHIIDIIVLQWSAPSCPRLHSRQMDSCLKPVCLFVCFLPFFFFKTDLLSSISPWSQPYFTDTFVCLALAEGGTHRLGIRHELGNSAASGPPCDSSLLLAHC